MMTEKYHGTFDFATDRFEISQNDFGKHDETLQQLESDKDHSFINLAHELW